MPLPARCLSLSADAVHSGLPPICACQLCNHVIFRQSHEFSCYCSCFHFLQFVPFHYFIFYASTPRKILRLVSKPCWFLGHIRPKITRNLWPLETKWFTTIVILQVAPTKPSRPHNCCSLPVPVRNALQSSLSQTKRDNENARSMLTLKSREKWLFFFLERTWISQQTSEKIENKTKQTGEKPLLDVFPRNWKLGVKKSKYILLALRFSLSQETKVHPAGF